MWQNVSAFLLRSTASSVPAVPLYILKPAPHPLGTIQRLHLLFLPPLPAFPPTLLASRSCILGFVFTFEVVFILLSSQDFLQKWQDGNIHIPLYLHWLSIFELPSRLRPILNELLPRTLNWFQETICVFPVRKLEPRLLTVLKSLTRS